MWTCFARILEWVYSGFSRDESQEDSLVDSPNVSTPTLIISNEPSSSNCDALHTYDVFLNHRGPDVKTKFVAHLYDALCTAGFHPFLDAKSLIKGQHAFNSINEALSGVRVHIAVFSKGYAESKYCLNELCDMLESGKDILPIFYDVEPDHLRRPHHGPFATAFRKHLKRGRRDDIKRWEEALLKVANITGFRLNEVNGDESQLKKKVVMKVQNIAPLDVFQQVRHGVGLNGSMAEVVNQLGLVGILGIVGMGGIGKTTLAKAVYNEYLKGKHFERQSFLHNARTTDLLSLQKQLVHDLLGEELKFTQEFHNCFIRLSRDRKVFVVIDDIDDINQFDQLIPSLPKFMSQGSQILVTSRDQHVLNYITIQGSIGKSNLYEVRMLDVGHAQQLFNWHAFHDKWASDGFRDLAKEVVNACNGLPLALEVMGAYLFDKKDPKHKVVWKEAIRSLNMDPGAIDQKLQNMFNISYEGLSSQANKLMLLDIACFMINRHESMAMSFWESCILCPCPSSKSPHSSLMKLIEKSLVKVDENGYLQMHDVIRDMARDVVKKESLQEVGKRSHLWDFIETKEVLHKDKGSAKIRGLHMSGSKLHTPLAVEKFATMTRLHLLFLDDCQVEGDFSTLSKELRWLTWCNLTIVELPTNLNLPNLVVLNLTKGKNLKCLWEEDPHTQVRNNQDGPFKLLERLVLKDCIALERLPKNIGKLSKLKVLNLNGCWTLKTLPSSIGTLKTLEDLDLANCFMLEALPNSIGNLSNLKTLRLNYCKNLKELPMTFGNLQNLVYLWAKGASFFHLSNSFSNLLNLEVLDLNYCMNLHDLPPSISGLVKLKKLYMGKTNVEKLPEDIGQLQSLEILKLARCKYLKTLPESFGCLEQLEHLDMSKNPSLEMFPESFGRLKALKDLKLNECSTLTTLPSSIGALKALKDLDLAHCFMLEALPNSIGNLSNLKTLHLNYCKNLKELSMTFGNLQNLVDLWGEGASFFHLPNSFSNLLNLEVLDLDYCMNLHDLPPSISGLVKLKKLYMGETKVEKLPEDIGQLQSLEILKLARCKYLKTLPESFGCLEQLEHLDMSENPSLEMFPESFGRLKALKDLNLGGCSTLTTFPSSIGALKALKDLDLAHCFMLEALPNSIGNLSNLKTLHLNYCKNLKELSMTFGNLQNLVYLWGEGASFFHLPNSFSHLLNLEVLDLDYCMNLHDLPPSIFGLVKLRELYMGETKVEKLPEDIGQLQSLKMLKLARCKHLKILPESFGCLKELEHLVMFENPSLEMLPESFGRLQALNHLNLGGCLFGEGIGLPSNVGDLTNLKSLFLDGNLMRTCPESFKDLNALVTLQMLQCPNLVVVQALPSNLERLNIGNCPKLTNIPYLGNLNTLKYLILNDCPKLTHLQGLDFVQTLVEVNISGSKMLSIAFGLNHDRALQMCGLSGSQSSMIYDNNWWKKEPTLQVVSYYDNVLPQPFPNSIRQKFVIKQQSKDKLCLNATILNEEECVAIIFCFCAHELERRSPFFFHWGSYNGDLCFMEARILKNGVEVNTCHLFTLRHDDPVDQIYLCTLRKDHQFVKSLQFGDQVHVYAQFGKAKWASIVVEEVAIIMVHGEDGHPTFVVNSIVLDNTMSQNLQRRLSKLTLKNNPTIDSMVQKFTTSFNFAYCDYCYKNITSPLWKCSVCKDFVLCGNCYEVRSNNPHDINGHVNWHPIFLVHI